jgi:hypothetical protein
MSQNCNCHGTNGKYSQTVIGELERPLYAPGLVLRDSDLTAAVDYTQSLNRMLFKHLFGCGVICGLEVKASEHCGLKIEVSDGLALDGCGDAVHLAKPVSFSFDERESEKLKDRKHIWVVLCGKEKLCAPRPLVCDVDDFDSQNEMTRARAMAEVSLVFEKPECICAWERVEEYPDREGQDGCINPYPFDCTKDCGCGSACGCGCCVLLGVVKFDGKLPVVEHMGVRRIAKPMLMKDSKRCIERADTPVPPPAPPPPAPPAPPPPTGPVRDEEELTLKEQNLLQGRLEQAEKEAMEKGLKGEELRIHLEMRRVELKREIIASRPR